LNICPIKGVININIPPITEKITTRVIRAASQLGTLNFLMDIEVIRFTRGFPTVDIKAAIKIYQRIELKYHARNAIIAIMATAIIYLASLFILPYTLNLSNLIYLYNNEKYINY